MPLSQRSAGTATASALLAATLALTLVGAAAGKPKAPLSVELTAHPTHTVAYDWSLTKTAQPGGTIRTTAAETNVAYEVIAERDGGTPSAWRVRGDVALRNDSAHPIADVVAGVVAAGAVCHLDGRGLVGTLGRAESASLGYTCTYGPDGPGAMPRVGVDVTWSGGSMARAHRAIAFAKPTKVVNGAVDVSDAFDGGPPQLLEGGGSLTGSRTFTYERTLVTPASGCRTYSNTAHLGSVPSTKKGESGGETGTARAEVTVCRSAPPKPAPSPPKVGPIPQVASAAPGPLVARRAPRARLRISKRGPRRARAGSLVRYRIRVSVTSAAAARRVVVRDLLPAGMVLAKRAPGVRVKGRRLIWTARGIHRTRTVTRIVTLRVLRSARGTRCNRADAIARNASRVRTRSCTRIVQPKSKPVSPAVLG